MVINERICMVERVTRNLVVVGSNPTRDSHSLKINFNYKKFYKYLIFFRVLLYIHHAIFSINQCRNDKINPIDF